MWNFTCEEYIDVDLPIIKEPFLYELTACREVAEMNRRKFAGRRTPRTLFQVQIVIKLTERVYAL